MEKSLILIILLASYSVAEEKRLACCPPSSYLPAGSEEKEKCWDPITKVTTPIRLDCNTSNVIIKAFSAEGENVILVDEFNDTITINSTLVCIGNETAINGAAEPWMSQVALMCSDETNDGPLIRDQFYIEDVVLGYCMMASTFFLILIVVIYSSFDDLRDNFGKCIINYCGSLAVGLFLMSIMKFLTYRGENLCAVRGFSTYFFLLAAFFWSNSVSISALTETWQTNFSDFRWFEFRWFLLYSWGMPALLTMIMAIVNYFPGDHARPGIGLKSCWFISLEQQWYYMYSVMSLILVMNVVIFILTLRVFWSQKRQGCYLKSTLQDVKFKIAVSVKLFFVLGLPWMFEMICASMETHIVWALISIFNSSQGVILFLILVVNRKTVRLMAASGWLCCCPSRLLEWYTGPICPQEKEPDGDGNNLTRVLDLGNASAEFLNPEHAKYVPQLYKDKRDEKDDGITFIDKA